MRTFAGLVLIALAGAFNPAPAAEPQPGDDCPDFTMQGSDGKTYSLSTFKGKQAFVIAWFPKAFTGGCTKECQSFREYGRDLKAYDVAYFTASCDPVDVNAKFAESLGLDYPILCDPTKAAAQAFGVSDGKKNPTRWTFYVGKDGKILHVDKQVNTVAHGADVAARLGALGVMKK